MRGKERKEGDMKLGDEMKFFFVQLSKNSQQVILLFRSDCVFPGAGLMGHMQQ